jgi:hypothetical protein
LRHPALRGRSVTDPATADRVPMHLANDNRLRIPHLARAPDGSGWRPSGGRRITSLELSRSKRW